MTSHVARAVALLAQATDTGNRAQAACSTADQHARFMRDTYTPIAEESGHDAPNAASRHVLDAQEALTEITNRLHGAAEALRTYAQRIAPGLAGNLGPDSVYRPTGTELVAMGGDATTPRRRAKGFAKVVAERRDDVSDATQSLVDDAVNADKAFHQLPEPPSPASTQTRFPTGDPPPAVRAVDTGVSYGGLVDVAMSAFVVVTGWKEFRKRRRLPWRRSRIYLPWRRNHDSHGST